MEKNKKIIVITIVILLGSFVISSLLNSNDKKDVLVNIVNTKNNEQIDDENTKYLVKKIDYENLTIKLKEDLNSGIIIRDKNKYYLTKNDIKIDEENIEIFFNIKKKIFYINKNDLIKEN